MFFEIFIEDLDGRSQDTFVKLDDESKKVVSFGQIEGWHLNTNSSDDQMRNQGEADYSGDFEGVGLSRSKA